MIISSRKVEDAARRPPRSCRKLGECEAIPADVSTPEARAALGEAVRARAPTKLEILVNNAGATWGAPLEEFPPIGLGPGRSTPTSRASST